MVASTTIDIDALTSAVSQLGSQIPSRLFRAVRRELSLVDITVLRFPDANNQFFEVSLRESMYRRRQTDTGIHSYITLLCTLGFKDGLSLLVAPPKPFPMNMPVSQTAPDRTDCMKLRLERLVRRSSDETLNGTA